MQIAEAIRLVARVTYKPGWDLVATHEPVSDVLVLTLGRDEPDAENSDEELSVRYTTTAAAADLAPLDEDDFLQWLFDTVVVRELHEVEEWLRLDGRPLKEPHPEQGRKRGIIGPGDSVTLPRARKLG